MLFTTEDTENAGGYVFVVVYHGIHGKHGRFISDLLCLLYDFVVFTTEDTENTESYGFGFFTIEDTENTKG